MMIIGFTGTRDGMSDSQKRQLDWVLALLTAPSTRSIAAEFHHGGARGADLEAAAIARRHLPADRIVAHLPAEHTSKALLARNRDIANACNVLIAAPHYDAEELRSGTWATVRYARKAGVPVIMLSRGNARPLLDGGTDA